MTQTLTTQFATAGAAKEFYDRQLLDNLYPNLYLYQLAEKRTLPRGSGKVIHFKKYFKAGAGSGHVIPFAFTEGTAIGLSALSAVAISTTVAGFAAAIGINDFVIMTAPDDVVKSAVFELSKGYALTMERQIRTKISGSGTILPATNGATGSSSLTGTASTINTVDIMRAAAALRQGDARAWSDNMFAAVVHPRVGFDLRNDATAGTGWTIINAGFQQGAQRVWQGEIGTLYGCRVIESTEAKQLLPPTASLFKISAGASGFVTQVIAPGAYGVVELESAKPKVFVKQPGSAGYIDPVNQKGSVGIKGYYAAVVIDAARMKRIPSGGRTL